MGLLPLKTDIPHIELLTFSTLGISNKGINLKQTNSISFSSFKTFAKKFGSKEELTTIQQEENLNNPSKCIKVVKKLSKLVNLSSSLPVLEESHNNKHQNLKNEEPQEYSVSFSIFIVYLSCSKSLQLIYTHQQPNIMKATILTILLL